MWVDLDTFMRMSSLYAAQQKNSIAEGTYKKKHFSAEWGMRMRI